MKHVVSVSIGSSTRNHKVELSLLGEEFIIERIGTDGDMAKAVELIRELDGKVDAFGLGGIDLYIFAGGKRYILHDALKMANAASKTPAVDGSGLKNSLEREVVNYLQNELHMQLRGKRVLMVSGVDRFGMAETFAELGSEMIFGDLVFTLGIPIKLRSLKQLSVAAAILLPILSRLPISVVYPTGNKQRENTPRFGDLYAWADIIAGDWHFIRRYMPKQLEGKVILTNTVTPEDIEELGRRKAKRLITTTPDLSGRSFGTNVIEASLVAVSGKRPEELGPGDYLRLLKEINFAPRVVDLN